MTCGRRVTSAATQSWTRQQNPCRTDPRCDDRVHREGAAPFPPLGGANACRRAPPRHSVHTTRCRIPTRHGYDGGGPFLARLLLACAATAASLGLSARRFLCHAVLVVDLAESRPSKIPTVLLEKMNLSRGRADLEDGLEGLREDGADALEAG